MRLDGAPDVSPGPPGPGFPPKGVRALNGRPGVGGFQWQQYNALSYAHIILCILTIGIVGYILDKLMSLIESRFTTA